MYGYIYGKWKIEHGIYDIPSTYIIIVGVEMSGDGDAWMQRIFEGKLPEYKVRMNAYGLVGQEVRGAG